LATGTLAALSVSVFVPVVSVASVVVRHQDLLLLLSLLDTMLDTIVRSKNVQHPFRTEDGVVQTAWS
jgi:hypothetical protein